MFEQPWFDQDDEEEDDSGDDVKDGGNNGKRMRLLDGEGNDTTKFGSRKCHVVEKVKENEMSCYFLNSGGDLVLHFLIYIIVKIYLLIVIFCMRGSLQMMKASKKDNHPWEKNQKPGQPNKKDQIRSTYSYKFTKFIVKANSLMGSGFIIGTLMAFQLDFLLAVWVNLRFVEPKGIFGTINFGLSALVVFVYLVVIVVIFVKQRQLEALEKYSGISNIQNSQNLKNPKQLRIQESLEYLKRQERLAKLRSWEFVREGINPKLHSSLWRYFNQFQMLKEFVIPFFVIIFINKPIIQIVPLLFLFGLSIYVLLLVKPYTSNASNIFFMIVELAYFLIFGTFLILSFGIESITEITKYQVFGYSIIGMIGGLILMYLVVGLVGAVSSLK